MEIHVVSALSDNYMYIICDKSSNACAVVDPVEPGKILDHPAVKNRKIEVVFTTHHHWDHAGGNAQIAKLLPGITIYGGDERVEALTKKVKHGDKFTLGSLHVTCLFTPCHTTGHICYLIESPSPEPSAKPVLFTGDTLFLSGCGRFFEGSATDMHHALNSVIGKLPAETLIYCGHEYSVRNLSFSLTVEPDNEATKKKLKECEELLRAGKPTVPSALAEEFTYNPFMRVTQDSVQKHAGKVGDAIATMKVIRSEKDAF